MMKLCFALPLCLLTFAACGDPWTPAAGPARASTAEASSVRTSAYLVASEGGVIRSPDGRARLIVPPGALMSDREVSLGVAPAAEGALSPTYVVEPAEMPLGAALTIEIELLDEVGWGRRATAAIQRAEGWEELPESLGAPVDAIGHAGDARGSFVAVDTPSGVAAPERARDFVVGAILQGGLIAAVAWEDAPLADAFCPGDDALTGCDAGFSPLGSWHLAAACSSDLAKLADPFETQCPASLAAVELRWEGQFHISASAVVAVLERSETIVTAEAPLACTDVVACAALSSDVRQCAAAGDRCRCVQRQTDPQRETEAPMHIDGDALVLTDGAGAERGRVRFCGHGDRMVLEARASAAHAPVIRYVLER